VWLVPGAARAIRENEITHALTEQANLTGNGLTHLANRPFGRETAGQIVELHGHLARAISRRSGSVFLASFVSKYLHFHCPIVPIFDSNAQASIGRFVDWAQVSLIRDAMAALPEWARAYRNFVAAFTVLHERAITETPLKPTVKELDHLLWQPT
jgi:hypothetical protein